MKKQISFFLLLLTMWTPALASLSADENIDPSFRISIQSITATTEQILASLAPEPLADLNEAEQKLLQTVRHYCDLQQSSPHLNLGTRILRASESATILMSSPLWSLDLGSSPEGQVHVIRAIFSLLQKVPEMTLISKLIPALENSPAATQELIRTHCMSEMEKMEHILRLAAEAVKGYESFKHRPEETRLQTVREFYIASEMTRLMGLFENFCGKKSQQSFKAGI